MHRAAVVYCSNPHYLNCQCLAKVTFLYQVSHFIFCQKFRLFFFQLPTRIWISSVSTKFHIFIYPCMPLFFIWIIYFHWIPFYFVGFLSWVDDFVYVHCINCHSPDIWLKRLFFFFGSKYRIIMSFCFTMIPVDSSPVITDRISNFLEGEICPSLWQGCMKCNWCSGISIWLKCMLFENSENPALSYSYFS